MLVAKQVKSSKISRKTGCVCVGGVIGAVVVCSGVLGRGVLWFGVGTVSDPH